MRRRLGKRATRKFKRNMRFVGALLALLIVIIVAFEVAPRNDDAPVLRVPSASEG
ncbi:MAG: hypothetical protein JWO25_505 [Alphaproteobacteria bacterium]|nr:hypothetical protein [Alphaproteobacteria bacterium]MDB5722447.1 hypothetical protein [Alphaproteobacteria bacterium]